jgi:hypothetical protein
VSQRSPTKRTIKSGRYELVRRLGGGAQGETWEARDHDAAGVRVVPVRGDLRTLWDDYVRRANEPPGPHETVAIKCFRVGEARAWKDVELAEREARTLASVDHPALPRYVEHFEEDGVLYLVMEKVEGESLAAVRARGARLGQGEVIRMLEDVGAALRYLHGRAPPIVHRDIKPGNVIHRPDGSFALVDFGAVRDRLRPAGGSTVVGTFGYMAPEQFQGRASPRSDVYGLGATALAMLTGEEPEELPHEGLRIDVGSALARGTPRGLGRALEAMLAPDPDERVSSVDEALTMLRGRDRDREGDRDRDRDRHGDRGRQRAAKRKEREARRRDRRARHARRPPLLPRVVAQLGLFVAGLVVWIVVGAVVPIVLALLSVLFGRALRRAAAACVRAARRSHGAMARASRWLGGERSIEAGGPAAGVRIEVRKRVAADEDEGEYEHEHEREREAAGEREEEARRVGRLERR